MLKSLLAGAMSLAQPMYAEVPYTHPYVKQVRCKHSLGTAFKVSPNKYLSVYHVTRNDGCTIEGKQFYVTYSDPFGDFSIISIYDPEPGGIPINCAGFEFGRPYRSIGFARGDTQSVAIDLRASGIPSLPGVRNGWETFIGIETVIPGMSGGPILAEDGSVVGLVNAYNGDFGLSWSRPLSETVLCR